MLLYSHDMRWDERVKQRTYITRRVVHSPYFSDVTLPTILCTGSGMDAN